MILSLFFTRGVSLKLWVETGLFEREKLLYEEHLSKGVLKKVYWFTYGYGDTELCKKLKKEGKLHNKIYVYEMPKLFGNSKIGGLLYSFVLPFYYNKILKKSDILKTNQIDGSWSAIFAKKIHQKPLIVRTGWTVTQLYANEKRSKALIKVYEWIEKYAYKNSDKSVVASMHNKYYLEKKYGITNIQVMRNFIDTDTFRDLNIERYTQKILFVGRLNSVKNLFNLITAISKTSWQLDIYGNGEQRESLEQYAKKLRAKVSFKGIVPNVQLAEIYNRYRYFILPSRHEGMPKTLLEAMACGCICIGTDVEGINEVIEDQVTGYLAKGTDSNHIKKVLQYIELKKEDEMIAKNGVAQIEKYYALNAIVKFEEDIFITLHNAK